jgi:hypothetical protein
MLFLWLHRVIQRRHREPQGFRISDFGFGIFEEEKRALGEEKGKKVNKKAILWSRIAFLV